MSTTNRVDFGGIHVRGAWNSANEDVVAELAFYTPSGQARLAELDEKALLQLAKDAIDAVEKLRTNAIRRHAATLRPIDPSPSTSARAMLDEKGGRL